MTASSDISRWGFRTRQGLQGHKIRPHVQAYSTVYCVHTLVSCLKGLLDFGTSIKISYCLARISSTSRWWSDSSQPIDWCCAWQDWLLFCAQFLGQSSDSPPERYEPQFSLLEPSIRTLILLVRATSVQVAHRTAVAPTTEYNYDTCNVIKPLGPSCLASRVALSSHTKPCLPDPVAVSSPGLLAVIICPASLRTLAPCTEHSRSTQEVALED
jgi:hypothetical protein